MKKCGKNGRKTQRKYAGFTKIVKNDIIMSFVGLKSEKIEISLV